MMMIRQHQDHSLCPCCDAPNEDNQHVLQCPSMSATHKWAACFNGLQTFLGKEQTNGTLQAAILSRVQAWRNGLPMHRYPAARLLQEAIAEQDEIGWWNFMLGRISKKFALIQDLHFKSIGSKKGGGVWARKLIKHVWELCWHMWDHRNSIKHKGETALDQRKLDEARQEVREEFAKGVIGLLQKDHHYVHPSKKEWTLQLDPENTTTWLSSVQQSRRSWWLLNESLAAQAQKQRQFMRSWLLRQEIIDPMMPLHRRSIPPDESTLTSHSSQDTMEETDDSHSQIIETDSSQPSLRSSSSSE